MHTSPLRGPLVGALLGVMLAACASSGSGSGPAGPSSDDRPARSLPALDPVPSMEADVTGEVPSDLLGRIVEDAADRAQVDPGAVEVTTAEAVTWSDGSLGCPEPGMMYTQALVEGYHVIVDADGTELDYRATADGQFRLCEQPGRPGG